MSTPISILTNEEKIASSQVIQNVQGSAFARIKRKAVARSIASRGGDRLDCQWLEFTGIISIRETWSLAG